MVLSENIVFNAHQEIADFWPQFVGINFSILDISKRRKPIVRVQFKFFNRIAYSKVLERKILCFLGQAAKSNTTKILLSS